MLSSLIYGILRVRFFGPTWVDVSIGPLQPKRYVISEGTPAMDITLGDNQFTTVHLQGLDAANLAGKFVSPPKWEVDRPDIVTITADADGLTCRVEAAIPPVLGDAVVTATDVDDPNVPPLTFNVSVGGESITHLGATIDPPQDRAATPPTP